MFGQLIQGGWLVCCSLEDILDIFFFFFVRRRRRRRHLEHYCLKLTNVVFMSKTLWVISDINCKVFSQM